MTNSKKIVVLFTLCLLTFFSQNQVFASLPHFYIFNSERYNFVQDIPSSPADGTHVFGTHKTSGNQLLLTARGGNIIEIAAKDVKTGRIIVLKSSTATCDSGRLCNKFRVKTCFTDPWGDCFCICGLLTSNSNSSAAGDDTSSEPTRCGGNLEGYVLDDQD